MWTLRECHLSLVMLTDYVFIVGPLFGVRIMNRAELTRQEYLTPRRIMLERLQQFIRKPDREEQPVKYFDSSEPLARFLHNS